MGLRFPRSRPNEHRQARYLAAILEELIDDCTPQTDLRDILHRTRGEILTLLISPDQRLSRRESLAG
jgi:hypothetical protein